MDAEMPDTSFHVSEQELLLAADGELSPRRLAKVQAHLAACWSCRARMRQIESTIVDFVQARQRGLDAELPPHAATRSMLQARLAGLAGAAAPTWRGRFLPSILNRDLALAGLALLLVTFAAFSWGILVPRGRRAAQQRAGDIPDRRLTPGMTQPLTTEELCSMDDHGSAPAIPRAVALRVFEAYGVTDPRPREYELDYLIAPELGGTNDIRNLWPQPYRTVPWDAHAKDALEDHLHELVCGGRLSLATAQRDIATDWIAAYKKYFGTEERLAMHAAFLKDRPWE
jgi:hypothetical protein